MAKTANKVVAGQPYATHVVRIRGRQPEDLVESKIVELLHDKTWRSLEAALFMAISALSDEAAVQAELEALYPTEAALDPLEMCLEITGPNGVSHILQLFPRY